ncbi:MAG TPA: YqgE/AlgH family protein [Nitrospiria bacterium]|jgi:putative transcriptional regulator|nr:YqgE/AlgH family protein [Nitrospiria bacterium]
MLPQFSEATYGARSIRANKTSILAACLMLAGIVPAFPADASGPARTGAPLRPGIFLLSAPRLNDPNFFHTVVLLVTYGKEGASGLIINRPTDVPLVKALPDLEGTENFSKPIYFGGPVSTNLMLVLLRSNSSLEGARNVLGDIYFTASRKVLTDALVNPDPDKKVRVYAGYSGWAPMQLDAEFVRGDWVIMDADPGAVFAEDPSKIWPAFFEGKEKIQIRVPDPVPDGGAFGPVWSPVVFPGGR